MQRLHPKTGWIEAITGSMFSGKSEELIRRLRRAEIARQRVQIFKPALDDRFEEDHIVSHSKMRLRSIPVADGRPTLGTWQGIYLYEHRVEPQRRGVVVHLLADGS